ncbi:hypothetical protein A3A75_06180 [Candidatus Woesebacteria bacterium RIFCSPLOWO2_01_FULL_39_10]|uniref:Glucose/Sorbosone dehydrogenase domain-containing protein n=1 Tax=Candidatus Woesebacteria bacterium RIFCSPLOWO2_01_FULL_39_10 TaxID=1802516 RepID=A0A1F8B5Y4_9BACT|nr:MAG: hypothetical protein A3A75_06180 [Candidatus Woesebacteria bacterium RIFCSPLOWO2_01_FULL_39_10]
MCVRKGVILPVILILITLVGIGAVVFWSTRKTSDKSGTGINIFNLPSQNGSSPEVTETKDFPRVSVFAEGLDTPWAIAFLPSFAEASKGESNGGMLVTERSGRVRFVSNEGQVKDEPVADIAEVKELSEGGLHGITLHPNFQSNNYVYVYYTYGESGGNTLNRVSRFTYNGSQMTDQKVIVDAIPGASNHDGGRIKFGPDKFLYITTGDAQNPSNAQNKDSLAGKILRVTDNGDPAPGNPFDSAQGKPSGDPRVYSYGHRNPQGITWDQDGTLWETEHGPSGFETGNDEFNKIEAGNNYGWSEIRGTQTRSGMVTPIIESGRTDTWAPAGLAYLPARAGEPAQAGVNGKFYFAGLRGQALYEVAGNLPNLKEHFKGEYGRLREVILGPDGILYVTTSNRDGRGVPKQGDDKILRINPNKL